MLFLFYFQVWRFNKTIFELEPHQGVPRYVTQESEQHSDTIVRRGLAFIIEHGFWKVCSVLLRVLPCVVATLLHWLTVFFLFLSFVQTELGKQHYFMVC